MSRTPYSPFVEKAMAPLPWKLVRWLRGVLLVPEPGRGPTLHRLDRSRAFREFRPQ